MFHFESKIYEIENEDEEEVNSNGPIFHEDVHAHRKFFIFTFIIFGTEPTTSSTQGADLVIV